MLFQINNYTYCEISQQLSIPENDLIGFMNGSFLVSQFMHHFSVFSLNVNEMKKLMHACIKLILASSVICSSPLFLPAQSWDAFSYSLLVRKASFC